MEDHGTKVILHFAAASSFELTSCDGAAVMREGFGGVPNGG